MPMLAADGERVKTSRDRLLKDPSSVVASLRPDRRGKEVVLKVTLASLVCL